MTIRIEEVPCLCRRCILPSTFPGIRFDDEGVCNYCHRQEKALEKSTEKRAQYRQRLDDLISSIKDKAPVYDAVMAYSGGKDSSYTMKLLREKYELTILAITFDNHFVSPTAWDNIEKVTDALGVDHMNFRPPWPVVRNMFSTAAQKDIFPAPQPFEGKHHLHLVHGDGKRHCAQSCA